MEAVKLGKNIWSPPDQAAAEDFHLYSKEFDLKKCEDDFFRVTGACASFVEDSQLVSTILNKFLDCRKSNRPASFIRVGDGEGTVLGALLHRYPHLTKYNLKRISKIWYGTESVVEKALDRFGNVLLESIASADVIGAPGIDTIRKSFALAPEDLDVRGMCGMRGVYNYISNHFDTALLAEKIWTSTWYSRWLLPHYRKMFQDLPFAGLVTCYSDMGEKLQGKFNIAKTHTHVVPMQASIARVHKDIHHFPDVFEETCKQLSPPFQGAIYIVAAGILSKPYCHILKQRGGIAIDIGSTADIWMNKVTRPGVTSSFVEKWRLS